VKAAKEECAGSVHARRRLSFLRGCPWSGVLDEREREISKRRNAKMDLIRKLYVKTNELARGQTMTEYALILAAVAVVVYAGYQTLGTTINSALSTVDGQI
jgi:Flp pilus assembly pilin Flp